jgi:hypothetical protein
MRRGDKAQEALLGSAAKGSRKDRRRPVQIILGKYMVRMVSERRRNPNRRVNE